MDEFFKAQKEYLEQRMAELRAELAESERTLGIPLNAESVSQLISAIADAVANGGDKPLADLYRRRWHEFNASIEAIRGAVAAEAPMPTIERLQALSDEAEEQYERVEADVTAFFSRKA